MTNLNVHACLAVVCLGLSGLGGCTHLVRHGEIPQGSSSMQASVKELTKRGIAAVHRGELALAKSIFYQAIRIDETYGPAHNNLGRVHFEQGELLKASEAFGWALEFMPERPQPLNNLGLVYESAGKLEDAIGLYQQARELEPANPEYLANLVRARIRHGEVGSEVNEDLKSLKLIENRPEWSVWVDEQLALSNRSPEPAFSETKAASTEIVPELSIDADESDSPPSGPELLPPNNGAFPSVILKGKPQL